MLQSPYFLVPILCPQCDVLHFCGGFLKPLNIFDEISFAVLLHTTQPTLYKYTFCFSKILTAFTNIFCISAKNQHSYVRRIFFFKVFFSKSYLKTADRTASTLTSAFTVSTSSDTTKRKEVISLLVIQIY